jgi:hypothetical protein
MLEVECKGLARNVVDFSLAQRKGIIAAYMDTFNVTDRNEASAQIKECQEHFRQSVTRIKRNRAVIQAEEAVSRFIFYCQKFEKKENFNGHFTST